MSAILAAFATGGDLSASGLNAVVYNASLHSNKGGFERQAVMANRGWRGYANILAVQNKSFIQIGVSTLAFSC